MKNLRDITNESSDQDEAEKDQQRTHLGWQMNTLTGEEAPLYTYGGWREMTLQSFV